MARTKERNMAKTPTVCSITMFRRGLINRTPRYTPTSSLLPLRRQRVGGLVEPFRQGNGFPEQLRDALDGSAEGCRRVAHARQRLLHAWPKLSWGALELCNLQQRGLVVERVLTVQGEQGLHQFVHGARQAGGGPVGVGPGGDLGGELREGEFGHEEVVLDHGP